MKRLYRDREDEKIAGVCSGIANYLDVDVTAIRLIFVLLFFIGGGGLWIYLVLWIIMPFDPNQEPAVAEIKPKQKTQELPKMAESKKVAEVKPAPKKAPAKKPVEKKLAEKPAETKKPATKPKTEE